MTWTRASCAIASRTDDPADDDSQSREALIFEQAVAREALRLAYVQHREFATTLKGVQQQRSVGDTFSQETGGQTIVDNMKLDLLVASGGVLSHAPRMHQTAMMLIDAFEPSQKGFNASTQVEVVLSTVHARHDARDTAFPLSLESTRFDEGQKTLDIVVHANVHNSPGWYAMEGKETLEANVTVAGSQNVPGDFRAFLKANPEASLRVSIVYMDDEGELQELKTGSISADKLKPDGDAGNVQQFTFS